MSDLENAREILRIWNHSQGMLELRLDILESLINSALIEARIEELERLLEGDEGRDEEEFWEHAKRRIAELKLGVQL